MTELVVYTPISIDEKIRLLEGIKQRMKKSEIVSILATHSNMTVEQLQDLTKDRLITLNEQLVKVLKTKRREEYLRTHTPEQISQDVLRNIEEMRQQNKKWLKRNKKYARLAN
jgi:uncharacterized protein YllA (UPF0747 family)